MIVRPIDVGGLPVVALAALWIGIDIARMKIVRGADAADRANGRTEVLMIARDEETAACLPEPRDRVTLGGAERVSRIDGNEPHLIETGLLDPFAQRVALFFVAPPDPPPPLPRPHLHHSR